MLKSSVPLSALASMGLAKGSELSLNLAAKPQSVRLSSAPESMSAPKASGGDTVSYFDGREDPQSVL